MLENLYIISSLQVKSMLYAKDRKAVSLFDPWEHLGPKRLARLPNIYLSVMYQVLSVPVSPVNCAVNIVESKQFKARGFFVELEHPEVGNIKFPSPPYRFSQTPCKLEHSAPPLSEQNEELYCGRLEYDEKDLVIMRRANIV